MATDTLTSRPWSTRLYDLFSIDFRTLALLRVAMATLILCDLAARAFYIEVNYTDAGVLPSKALRPEDLYLSLRFISGRTGFR